MKISKRQLRRIIREAIQTDAWGRQIEVPDMIEWKVTYVDGSTGITNTAYVEAATEEDAREQLYGVRIRSVEPLETAKSPQETPFVPHEVGLRETYFSRPDPVDAGKNDALHGAKYDSKGQNWNDQELEQYKQSFDEWRAKRDEDPAAQLGGHSWKKPHKWAPERERY